MFNSQVDTEYEIIMEGEQVLLRYLGPAKATRFWTAINKGAGDYLKIKKDLFKEETVDTLYQKNQTISRGEEGIRKPHLTEVRSKETNL